MDPSLHPNTEPTRRDFARTLALAATASLAAVADPPSAEAADPPRPEGPPAVAQALVEAARARYGKHLNDDQFAALQRSITNTLLGADRLLKLPLKNGDEPAVIFRADLP